VEYAVPQFSQNQISKAGALLVSPKPWMEGADFDNVLEIINNHRASHNFPLIVFRLDLARRAHKVDLSATIGQRIKRLRSIEAKLQRFPTMRLARMQDIGGCRAVVRTAQMVLRLADFYKKCRTNHKLLRFDDYLTKPRESGYRGIHLIYAYRSATKKQYNDLKIEIQLRSRQQHAWATAVETVDTFTGQALKGGRGTREWRRFLP
jgi:ppGpp synthetase/RelA/SpoT-type nucleotidyltranferase